MLEEEPVRDKILEFFASRPYYRCALLVSPDIARLERQATELAHESGWPISPLGRELSAALLSAPPSQRPRAAREALRQILSPTGETPSICISIDLLFEPSLHLDPLAVFRQTSRFTGLVVAWPGHYDGRVLSYAVPENAHYRTWASPEVYVCLLGK